MLDELRLIIGLLKGELQYGAVPLEEIFEHLEQRTDGKLAIFFGRTAEEMKATEKNSLEKVLKKTADACLSRCGLTEKEQKQLVQICTLLWKNRQRCTDSNAGRVSYGNRAGRKSCIGKDEAERNHVSLSWLYGRTVLRSTVLLSMTDGGADERESDF